MNKGLKILAFATLAILGVAALGYITMTLWNWLVPVLFNGPLITFWQALGLFILSKILFSGFGKGHHHSPADRRHWKQKFYSKFSSMSPEERDAVRQKMKEKWCNWESRSKDTPGTND